MRLPRIGVLAVLLALAAPSAKASSTQLAPSFGFCGTYHRQSTSPVPGADEGRVAASCVRQTGAGSLFAEDPALITDRTTSARVSTHFYIGDQIAPGTKHRRYTVRIHVDDARVNTIAAGLAGPQIDAGIAVLPDSECRRSCGNPGISTTIAGGLSGAQHVTDADVVLTLDWLPEPTGPGTLFPGSASILVWIQGWSNAAVVGPASFSAEIASIHVSAETLA